MSKWLDALKASNKARVLARLDKLKKEYNEYKRESYDFPWDRYIKAYESREKEMDELLEFLDGEEDLKRDLDDYKDHINQLKKTLGKIGVLAANIETCDRESDANLREIQRTTSNYTHLADDEVKRRAKVGVW